MKIVFYAILLVHGLIHLMGVAKAFNLASLEELSHSISKPFGLIWLATTILFLLTFILLVINASVWWIAGLVAIMLSQLVIITTWSDAKWGTIANLIILVPVIIAYMGYRPDSFKNRYETIVKEELQIPVETEMLTESDLEHLPELVQKYLRYVGAVDKPKVNNFRASISGEMKLGPEKPWQNINAQQYNFYKPRSRNFYIWSKLFGIPFDGLHSYLGDKAIMEIKIASLFKVADARGEKMTMGETVTLFNDMCFFAPPTLIDTSIQWRVIDPLTVEATFSNAGHEIKAQLYFNEKGEMIDFSSEDRYESRDGKTYERYKWTTPVSNYKSVNGRKIPSYGEAIWHHPEGPFLYAKFNIDEVEYNCKEHKGIRN